MNKSNEDNLIEMFSIEDFKVDTPNTDSNLSGHNIKLRNIMFKNFMAFQHAFFDFTNKSGDPHSFCCFHGPNGCGKTTVLNAIQTIFSNFDAYNSVRLNANLGKLVRRIDVEKSGTYIEDNFLVVAEIQDNDKIYKVELNKNGFVKKDSSGNKISFDHPPDIKGLLHKICFFARFDMELDKFQLRRDKWDLFKDLFESVTGFEIEESLNVFSLGSIQAQSEIMDEYVFSFKIHKPNETILNKDCSAGERKIIKSFSTLLNKEYNPSIILVDNVAMHVESGRHLNLINSMKRCFPDSQLFATTHSYNISKNFSHRSQLYDLRFITATGKMKDDKWRFFLIDEIKDSLLKVKSMSELPSKDIMVLEGQGENLIELCRNHDDVVKVKEDVKSFTSEISKLFIDDIVNYHLKGEIQ